MSGVVRVAVLAKTPAVVHVLLRAVGNPQWKAFLQGAAWRVVGARPANHYEQHVEAGKRGMRPVKRMMFVYVDAERTEYEALQVVSVEVKKALTSLARAAGAARWPFERGSPASFVRRSVSEDRLTPWWTEDEYVACMGAHTRTDHHCPACPPMCTEAHTAPCPCTKPEDHDGEGRRNWKMRVEAAKLWTVTP